MSLTDTKARFAQWEALLAHRQDIALRTQLQEAPQVEVAEFLASQSLRTCIKLLSLFDVAMQANLLSHFGEALQVALYNTLPKRAFAHIFIRMDSDVRADLYQHLDKKQQTGLLPFLPKQVRQDVITLSSYPTETAGSIMSTDFVTIGHQMEVRQALEKIREDAPSKKMLYYLYVVDDEMRMLGFVPLKDVILSAPHTAIATLLHDTFVFAQVADDQESVAQKIAKYDLVAIPILNEEEQLVGIVSYDDAIDIIREEQTEDMERFMGIVSDDQSEDYLATSSWHHFKRRIGWISSLFVASFLSGYIMHHYEAILAQITALALYMTTINDAGGNAGSQAATVVIRALALKQITLGDWLRILLKELQVALLTVSCLFLLAFTKVYLLTGPTTTKPSIYMLGIVIATAVSLQVITATIIGAMLPLLVKRLGGDPALAASPAITTIVDLTGMLIYFSIAYTWLILPT